MNPASSQPWYRTITPAQWRVLGAALPGWMLDSMDVVIYLEAITTLREVFHFGTEKAGLLATATLLMSAVGGIFFGVLADKIGRTRALMTSILVYSLCSLGTATSQSLVQLMIWRSLLGLGMGGEWACGAVLVSETWPAEHRGKALSIMQSGWALGYMLAAVLSALILPTLGWRWLFVVGALPALLIAWMRRSVGESQMWLAVKKSPEQGNPLKLLLQKPWLERMLTATLLTALTMFAYWGLFSWLPAFLGTPVEKGGAGMNIVKSTGWIVTMQAGAFFGYLSFGFISDRLGRRCTFMLFMVAAAILVPVYGAMARNEWALMVLGPFLGFFGSGYFSVFGVMLSELFPTQVRAAAQGICFNMGRALSALAPFVIGVAAKTHGIGPALALTSAFFVAAALVMLLIPETRGNKLES